MNALAGRTGGVVINDDVEIDGSLLVTEGITGQLLSNQDLEDTDSAIILQRQLDNSEAINVDGPSISFQSSLGVVENFQSDAILSTERNVETDGGVATAPSRFKITMPNPADTSTTSGQKEMFSIRIGDGALLEDTTFVDGTSPSLGAHLQLRKLSPTLAELTDVPFDIGSLEFSVDTRAMLGGSEEALGASITGVTNGVFGGLVTDGELQLATAAGAGPITRAILKASGNWQGNLTDNGAYWEKGFNSELLTLTGSTTDTVGNLLPANSLIESVVVFVTETITRQVTPPTIMAFGSTVQANRFIANGVVGLTAGSSGVGLQQWRGSVTTDNAGPHQPSAGQVRVTIDGAGTVLSGIVRITVFYTQFIAPTS